MPFSEFYGDLVQCCGCNTDTAYSILWPFKSDLKLCILFPLHALLLFPSIDCNRNTFNIPFYWSETFTQLRHFVGHLPLALTFVLPNILLQIGANIALDSFKYEVVCIYVTHGIVAKTETAYENVVKDTMQV